MEKLKIFEGWGIFVSIVFARDTAVFIEERKPMWAFQIDTIEENLFHSSAYIDYDECIEKAFSKAVDMTKAMIIENHHGLMTEFNNPTDRIVHLLTTLKKND